MELLKHYKVYSELVFVVEAEYEDGSKAEMEATSEKYVEFIMKKLEEISNVKQFNIYTGKRYTSVIVDKQLKTIYPF